MSTQTKTDSSQSNALQFNPQSQDIYNLLTKQGSGVLSSMMQNPFGNVGYKLGLGESQKGATALGNQSIQALMQGMRTSGIGGQAGNAFQTAQMGQIGRANQGLRSQGQIANIMNAFQRQMGATGVGMSFSPQITGSSGTGSQTQSTSGTGTWLPQLLGAGLGMGMSAMTGGMGGGGSFGGGLFKGLGGGAGAGSPSAIPLGMSTFPNQIPYQ